jgi:hypothetical protein
VLQLSEDIVTPLELSFIVSDLVFGGNSYLLHLMPGEFHSLGHLAHLSSHLLHLSILALDLIVVLIGHLLSLPLIILHPVTDYPEACFVALLEQLKASTHHGADLAPVTVAALVQKVLLPLDVVQLRLQVLHLGQV